MKCRSCGKEFESVIKDEYCPKDWDGKEIKNMGWTCWGHMPVCPYCGHDNSAKPMLMLVEE